MGEPNLSRRNDSRSLSVEGFTLCPTGVVVPESATFEQWERVGLYLQFLDAAVSWWVADWLAAGEARWGEMYAQAEAATGLNQKTLRDAKWVSQRIPLSRRRDNLSFAHHREVAALHPSDQEAILDAAEPSPDDATKTPRLTREQVRERVRELKKAPPPDFLMTEETEVIRSWLAARRAAWPADRRKEFASAVEVALERLTEGES